MPLITVTALRWVIVSPVPQGGPAAPSLTFCNEATCPATRTFSMSQRGPLVLCGGRG